MYQEIHSNPVCSEFGEGSPVALDIPCRLLGCRFNLSYVPVPVAREGAHGSTQTRTREEAGELAEQILMRAREGEDFADLAREYSDSASSEEGGRIGEIAGGMTVPAFDHAAFALKPGIITTVGSGDSGWGAA